MKLLGNLYCKDNLPLDGRVRNREAVRAIILDGSRLLMVFSKLNGDYKFPGGGIHPKESHTQALRRELREECGASLSSDPQPYGKVIEYDLPFEPVYDLFKMTSYYYRCQVNNELGRQSLDKYEQRLGFRPNWVELDLVLCSNAALLQDRPTQASRWAVRELFVLGMLKKGLEGSI